MTLTFPAYSRFTISFISYIHLLQLSSEHPTSRFQYAFPGFVRVTARRVCCRPFVFTSQHLRADVAGRDLLVGVLLEVVHAHLHVGERRVAPVFPGEAHGRTLGPERCRETRRGKGDTLSADRRDRAVFRSIMVLTRRLSLQTVQSALGKM